MNPIKNGPTTFHIPAGEAVEVTHSPYGSVGRLFTGEGLEAVWVKKEAEEIDPSWFSQAMVDLILVVQGKLKVEYERSDLPDFVLEAGDLLILPPHTRCRAFRWPRDAKEGTVFVAVYPKE